MDGTLLDTLDDLADAVNYALSQFGCPARTTEEVRCFVGNGVQRLIRQAVGDSGADVAQVLAVFQRYYQANCQNKTKPYQGVQEVLHRLAEKYPMAIVSNKPDAAVKALCREYFPGIYARGESAECPRKPAPDMVLQTMEYLGIDRCIYVGDSEVDLLTAKNAGVPCVSVTWGFRTVRQLADADAKYLCDTPDQLESILEKVGSLF